MVTPIDLSLSIDSWKNECSILKTYRVIKIENSHQMFCKKLKSSYNVSLLLLKIEHSFFQESIDNNKTIGVTIYRCQIQAIIKKRKTFEVFKLIYFKKPPIKKVLTKLRVISDASVLLKCWFYKQAPQKVLIELRPGVISLWHVIYYNIYFLYLDLVCSIKLIWFVRLNWYIRLKIRVLVYKKLLVVENN